MWTLGPGAARLRIPSYLLIAIAAATMLLACGGTSTQSSTPGLDRIKSSKQIRVAFLLEPPYLIANADGSIDGTCVEPIRQWIATIGKDITIQPLLMQFSAFIPSLQSGRVDVVPCINFNAQRCKAISFSNPDIVTQDALIVKKGNPLNITSYQSIAANPNARLAVAQGSAEIDTAKQNGIPDNRIILFPDVATAEAGLRAGRADAYVLSAISASANVKANPDLQLVAPLNPQPVGPNGKPAITYGGNGFNNSDADLVASYNAWRASVGTAGFVQIVSKFGQDELSVPPNGLTAKEVCTSDV